MSKRGKMFNCKRCGKERYISPCQFSYAEKKGIYCSSKCYGETMLNRKFSDEVLQKIIIGVRRATSKQEYKEKRRQIAKEKGFGKWMTGKPVSQARRDKTRDTMLKIGGGKWMKQYYKDHPERLDEMSKQTTERLMKTNFRYKGFFYSKKNDKNIPYRSSYELLAFIILEKLSDVVSYKFEPFVITYKRNHRQHRTIPDLLIDYGNGKKKLIEIKPQFKIDGNLQNTKEKLNIMKNFAKKHKYEFGVWSEKELNLRGEIIRLSDRYYSPYLESAPF